MSWRGKPTLLWSDHGTNFVGVTDTHEIKDLNNFLECQKNQKVASKFCSHQNVQWRFIPEHLSGLCPGLSV